MANLGTRTLKQILENQSYILYKLNEIQKGSPWYGKDESSEELQQDSAELVKELKEECGE